MTAIGWILGSAVLGLLALLAVAVVRSGDDPSFDELGDIPAFLRRERVDGDDS